MGVQWFSPSIERLNVSVEGLTPLQTRDALSGPVPCRIEKTNWRDWHVCIGADDPPRLAKGPPRGDRGRSPGNVGPARAGVLHSAKELRMSITILSDLGQLLDELPVGQSAELPYNVYELLFPPGEPDQGARTRAFDFARDHGCEISNQPAARKVVFIKKVTNPVRRHP